MVKFSFNGARIGRQIITGGDMNIVFDQRGATNIVNDGSDFARSRMSDAFEAWWRYTELSDEQRSDAKEAAWAAWQFRSES
jgi:hypothetical protein